MNYRQCFCRFSHWKPWILSLGLIIPWAAASIGAADNDPSAEAIHGEQLPASTIDAGYIETLADAIARDEARGGEPYYPKKSQIGYEGKWVVPSRRSSYYPHSGTHYVTNKAGDTKMAIGFPEPVNMEGTYIAGQGGPGVWATGIRAIGYFNGEEVGRTEWFTEISSRPAWFSIELGHIDRIVFEAQPVFKNAGWYALDDIKYTTVSTKPGLKTETTIIDFEDCNYRQTLTGSGYQGLTWEKGLTPQPKQDDESVHSPVVPPDAELIPDPDAVTEYPVVERGNATLPALISYHNGVKRGDAGQWSYPPDTCGAIGPNHFVEVVNRNFAVYNKSTGSQITNISLSSFLPGSSGDPRVCFDQHSGRWIVIVTDFNSRLYIAFSLTDNPTGSWYKSNFVMSQGSDAGAWPDYPTLGVDANGIYTAAFMVGGFGTMTIWAIDKAPLLEPTPSLGTITAWRQLSYEGAIQPCHTFGDSGGEYLVSQHPSFNTRLRVRQITGPMTNPTLQTVSGTHPQVPSYSEPPDAPALGSSTPLDTVGARMMNAVYRDGFIWTTHTIGYNGRAAVRWYKIYENTAILNQYGTVADNSLYYFFPSITVNDAGHAVMGFTGSNASQYAGCYYTGRSAFDPAGQMADPFQYQLGLAAQNNIDSYGRNRWGDYSLCTVDPVDNDTLWTIQEYGRSTNVWGTSFAQLRFLTGPENDYCASTDIIMNGPVDFTTVGATLDGPDEAGECSAFENDVWFRYMADCDGEVTLEVCNADFDTVLAVYQGDCPTEPGEFLACNDNSCGLQSELTFTAEAWYIYPIRIGGTNGEEGSGTLNITCGSPCPADLTGDDQVNIDDIFAVLGLWGDCPDPCPPYCAGDLTEDCTVNIDDIFAILGEWGPCD